MIVWPTRSPELAELAATAARFSEKVVGPLVTYINDHDHLPNEIVDALVANGYWGLALPEAVGGSEADLDAIALVVAEISAINPAVGLLTAASSLLSPPASAPDAVLTRLRTGGTVAVVDARSPLVDMRFNQDDSTVDLDAARVDGGARSDAALLLLPDGPAVVGIEDWSARQNGPTLDRTGLRGFAPCPIRWSGRCTPIASVTSEALREPWHVLVAAVATGIASSGSAMARRYISRRRQFGRTLIEFGSVRATWTAVDDTARIMARELLDVANRVATAAETDAQMAASLVRRCVQHAVQVSAHVIQMHGGYGYITETAADRLLRDAISLRAVAAGSAFDDATTQPTN